MNPTKDNFEFGDCCCELFGGIGTKTKAEDSPKTRRMEPEGQNNEEN